MSSIVLRIGVLAIVLSLFVVGCGDGANTAEDALEIPSDAAGDGEDMDDLVDSNDVSDQSDADTAPDVVDVPLPDLPPDVPPVVGCDPILQSDCPDGQHCMVRDANTQCYPTDPAPLPLGSTCEDIVGRGGCEPGAQCVTTNFDGPRCRSICVPATNQGCPTGHECRIATADDAPYGWCLDLASCNPLDPQACPGAACVLSAGDNDMLRANCAPVGTVADGQPCVAAPDCQRGSMCLGVAGDLRCVKLCDEKGVSPLCDAAQSCTDGVGADLVGPLDGIGVCL